MSARVKSLREEKDKNRVPGFHRSHWEGWKLKRKSTRRTTFALWMGVGREEWCFVLVRLALRSGHHATHFNEERELVA